MEYSHEAYFKPFGVEIKHSAIERRMSGFIVPRLLVAYRIAIEYLDEYPTKLSLLAPEEISMINHGEQHSEGYIEPFAVDDSSDLDTFVSIGASMNLLAFDSVRNDVQSIDLLSCRIIVPDLHDQSDKEELEAVAMLSTLTSSGLNAPFEMLIPQDFKQD